MRIGEEYLECYMRLFCHRRDAFALQTDEGTYYAARRRVSRKLVAAHLLGKVTAGWYALDEDNTLGWAALDVDQTDGLTQLQKVGLALREREWSAYLEDSRRGGHLWVFFSQGTRREERIRARPVRIVLGDMVRKLGLEEEIEIFPRQDEIGQGGLGSLVRGPLGVHRACGRRFSFLDLESLDPVGETLAGELEYVAGFETVTAAQVAEELARILDRNARSRELSRLRRKASTFEGGALQELKEEIGDLYGFISRFLELDEKGRGHCPFHPPDRHPSFVVNREENYWVDFHDQTGGDAIAFYQRLKGIGFVEATRQLARMYDRGDLINRLEGRKAMNRDRAEVLTGEQVGILEAAEEGALFCPECGEPLTGEFVDLTGFFVGILLYCSRCSFVDTSSAPARSWERSEIDATVRGSG